MKDIKNFFPENNKKIILLDEVNSTNTYAKEIARRGEASGTVVIANAQTDGKGRLGRSFFSPVGTSIYMSIILRPNTEPEKVSLLTSCAAVATARAADKICGIDTKIKWVNDLFLNGKKFCGILTESVLNSTGKPDFAVVGIGVNVKSIKKAFPQKLLETATSIEDETGKSFSREAIAAQIIKEMDILIPNFDKGGFVEEYRRRMCIIGCRTAVTMLGKERIGKAVGINDNAGLIVQFEDGSSEIVTSGEARIII